MNDENIEHYEEKYGKNMSIAADFTEYLSTLATRHCRFLLAELIKNEKYADKFNEANFSFLRTNHAYEDCMKIAY